jgi:hypothetical protein
MATRLLQYEIPTRQAEQLTALDQTDQLEDADDAEEVAWGSDPFDILAHKESTEN